MNEAPERIWATVEPDWHDGETGENFCGGDWAGDYDRYGGVEYVRADVFAALEAENARLRAEVWREAAAVARDHAFTNAQWRVGDENVRGALFHLFMARADEADA